MRLEGSRVLQERQNAMGGTSHSDPSDFFFQTGLAESKRMRRQRAGLTVTTMPGLVTVVITF